MGGKPERVLSIDDIRFSSNDQTANRIRLDFKNDDEKVVLYNSNEHARVELIRLNVNTPYVAVFDEHDKPLKDHQVSLVWPNLDNGPSAEKWSSNHEKMPARDDLSASLDFEQDTFELLFHVRLPPLSLSTFTIRKVPEAESTLNKDESTMFYFREVSEKNMKEMTDQISAK